MELRIAAQEQVLRAILAPRPERELEGYGERDGQVKESVTPDGLCPRNAPDLLVPGPAQCPPTTEQEHK